MMIQSDFFQIFLLAHLIGDFALQTNKIAKEKAESIKGLVVHCAIITAVQILLLAIFGLKGIITGALCGVIHFFIDYAKVLLGNYISKYQLIYFAADQVIHISVILGLSLIFAPAVSLPDVSFGSDYMGLVHILISLIVLIYVSTVTAKILVRDVKPQLKAGVFFNKHERLLDVLCAVILYGIWAYAALPWGCLPILLGAYLYVKCQWILYRYDTSISLVKYIVFVVFAFMVKP